MDNFEITIFALPCRTTLKSFLGTGKFLSFFGVHMKTVGAIAVLSFSGFVSAGQILVDDFSERSPTSWWSNTDVQINQGSMLGGYRYTEAFGGLTPVTLNGVQTGNSWRDRGSNTGNSWGLATVGQSVVELDLDLGSHGYISANFLDLSNGIQVRAEVASYVSGYGYSIKYDAWSSPTFTLSHGAQAVNFNLSSFLPNGSGQFLNPNNIDSIRLWVTQQVGVYPALGSPAYVLDSVYAVSAVPEPTSVMLFLSGLLLIGGTKRRSAS